MEERRSNGFRVKPSFGQVLGYIQEGEPLTLDLPNRKASIYTSSHFYLDDYPNAPEPVSDAPLPHTSINPAAAFETADEGRWGPLPTPAKRVHEAVLSARQRRRGHGPGAGAAQRRAEPAQASDAGGPHEGERHSGRGGDRGGRRGGRAAVRSAENPEAATGTGPPTGRGASTANHAFGSGAFAGEGGAAAGAAEAAAAAEGGGMLAALGEGALAAAGTVGAAAGGLAVAGAGAAIVGTAWAIEGGLNAAAHMWGATTGGGTDSDASRPSHATDVQTLNGMQQSGAVDHFYAQEQRRRQQPQVFRIDTTESEGEPQVQPQQQIRARPVRRPRAQPTPFGINQVPIPVSSGSERVSRQSRGDRRLRPAVLRRPSSGERT